MNARALLAFLGCLALAVMGAAAQSAPDRAQDGSGDAWRQKVAPALLAQLSESEPVEFIVFLEGQAALDEARAAATRAEKGRLVYETLSQSARQTQEPLLQQLQEAGAEYRSYWIANMIWVRGDGAALRAMAQASGVAHVYANPYRQMALPMPRESLRPDAPQAIEPNIALIRAPELWDLGYSGQGAVIGGQDTGYDWDHPALRDQYRGWNGSSAVHSYHWHDAIHSGGGVCGADAPEPCDDSGHGTHTMGTIVGDDGGPNQIGVAPGAKWIGCRNMDRGVGSPVTYSECFQWFVAPTDGDGLNPDPSMAPHVINNSWACTVAEGCSADEVAIMQTVVENVRAAGIMVVASAGNSGSACGSVRTPPAIYEAAFSVGATDNDDNIAGFSSRGPVQVNGSNRIKPHVVAPGVNVRSSIPGGAYGSSSGTSMAAPHVAGLVALLLSANPLLAGRVEALELALTEGAVPLTTDQECGGVPGDEVPNNTYGHGRIDAVQAYEHIAGLIYWNYLPTLLGSMSP